MTTSAGPRSTEPLVTVWKRHFHLATDGSASHAKGLALHRNGAVGQLHAAPGRFSAAVTVKRAALKAALSFPALTEEQGHALTARLVDVPAAVADLLAGRLSAAIADLLAERVPVAADGPAGGGDEAAGSRVGGVSVVPGADEIRFSCTCPPGRAGRVCDHSAAVGHAVAERLAGGASLLLTARGMRTRDLAALLRARVTDTVPGALPADAHGTVRADQAYSLWTHRPPQRPGTEERNGAGAWAETGAGGGPDSVDPLTDTLDDPPAPCPPARELAWMTEDAADRARALLAGTGAAGRPHDELADVVRVLATPDGVHRIPDAVRATGRDEAALRTSMIGYRHGGPAGAHAALAPAPVPDAVLERARDAVRASRALSLGGIDVVDGALTDTTAGVQLRPGPDGRWFPFTSFGGEWRPAAGCSADPVEAYRAARRARTARPTTR
ncbi:hypothetical protein [Streptomyces sp. CB01580]|uniref:hypothetical protein n=1 Tax=Streptomyces sp. CB01580 TaxID=1703933 RepID=UPI00093DB4A6|nr:hypothetical protein [Streptomyces sp. CB01580]OKJ32477.1 hypothetical protein AMK22_22685 [Streptomyces sp. CB01580]